MRLNEVRCKCVDWNYLA